MNNALTLTLALGLAALSVVGPAEAAAIPLSFAVIGDVPYGADQLAGFSAKIDEINADPDVQLVSHLGDISEPPNCTTAYYSTIKARFNRFTDPLVYTPGDNEWADCSKATAGSYDPLERLATLRRVFYPTPGLTLGQHPLKVTSQASTGMPESVRFIKAGISFAVLDIAGSNNGLKPWAGETGVTARQAADVTARTTAAITLMHSAFTTATSKGSRAVVLITQADMFDSSRNGPTYRVAFTRIVQALAKDAAAYGRPVFLINGDSHRYVKDRPLTNPLWLDYYGAPAVPGLTRVTIQGGELVNEWLKVTAVPDPSVLSIERMPFRCGAAVGAP